GNLAYIPGPGTTESSNNNMSVDLRGHLTALTMLDTDVRGVQVSPDGSQIVANRAEGALWIYSYSLIRRTAPRQLATPGSSAVWTPDGKRITFRAGRSKSKPTEGMFSQRADGIGSAELLLSVDGRPVGWSRDGTTLFYISERQLWSWRRGEKPRS